MKLYKLVVKGYGSCHFDTLAEAEAELELFRVHFCVVARVGATVPHEITEVEMTEAEVEALGEFTGW